MADGNGHGGMRVTSTTSSTGSESITQAILAHLVDNMQRRRRPDGHDTYLGFTGG